MVLSGGERNYRTPEGLLRASYDAGLAGVRLLGRGAMHVLSVLLALLVLFEEWGWQPLVALVGRLRRLEVWARFEHWIEGLPPYPALAVLGLPSLAIVPVKLLALFSRARRPRGCGPGARRCQSRRNGLHRATVRADQAGDPADRLGRSSLRHDHPLARCDVRPHTGDVALADWAGREAPRGSAHCGGTFAVGQVARRCRRLAESTAKGEFAAALGWFEPLPSSHHCA